jgi:sulfate transport system substrate-binding protein
VSFSQSYGPSGEQSRAVANGLSADVVNLSTEPDVEKLVKAGLVSPSWNQNATHGFVTDSVAVIIVRKGNPKHIAGWSDLIKPGVGVLTPNPFTSGSARWNVMAAYGAQLKEGKSPAEAQAYLTALFHNVVSQDSSARNALQTFLAGRGDALIDYEDEAIADEKKGAAIEYVIPKDTILIQNPIAVLSAGNTTEAQKFVNYLLSPAGQAIWAEKGYRPVISGVPGAGKFPTPPGLFTIESLGGWKAVTKQFFEPETGIVAGSLHCQVAPRRSALGGARARAGPGSARGAAERSARACWASTCRPSCCSRSRHCWRSRAVVGRAPSGERYPTRRRGPRSS